MEEKSENDRTTARAGSKVKAEAEAAKAAAEPVIVDFGKPGPEGSTGSAADPVAEDVPPTPVELGPRTMGRLTIGLVLMGLLVMFVAVPIMHDLLPALRVGREDSAAANNVAEAVAPGQTKRAPTKAAAPTKAPAAGRTRAPSVPAASTPTASAAAATGPSPEACARTCEGGPQSNECLDCGHQVWGWPARQ